MFEILFGKAAFKFLSKLDTSNKQRIFELSKNSQKIRYPMMLRKSTEPEKSFLE